MEFPFTWDGSEIEGEDNPLNLTDRQRKVIMRLLVIVSLNAEVFIDNYEDIDQNAFEDFIDSILHRLA